MLLNGGVFGRKSTQWEIRREVEMVVSGGEEERKQLRGVEWRRTNRNEQTLEISLGSWMRKAKRTSKSENVSALWMGTNSPTSASHFFNHMVLVLRNLYQKSDSSWNGLDGKGPLKKQWFLEGELCCSFSLFSSPACPFKHIDRFGSFRTHNKVLGESLQGHLQQLVGC